MFCNFFYRKLINEGWAGMSSTTQFWKFDFERFLRYEVETIRGY